MFPISCIIACKNSNDYNIHIQKSILWSDWWSLIGETLFLPFSLVICNSCLCIKAIIGRIWKLKGPTLFVIICCSGIYGTFRLEIPLDWRVLVRADLPRNRLVSMVLWSKISTCYGYLNLDVLHIMQNRLFTLISELIQIIVLS